MAPPAALAGSVAARSPALRRLALALGVLVAFLVVVPVAAIIAATSGAAHPPSAAALADIPATYLALYQRTAATYELDWAILAAVGKVECDHGRNRDPGCRPFTANAAGAVGPMQFLPPTWALGHAIGETRVAVPPAPDGQGYATDGDGDGTADIWQPADAIAGAARLLVANGAPGDYARALFAYNHADWYVDKVLDQAAEYRGALSATGDFAAAIAWAQRYLGTAYVWGGNHGASLETMRRGQPSLAAGRDGRRGYFDCSSLVAWAYANGVGIHPGDTTWEQWEQGATDPRAQRGLGAPPDGWRSGDLAFFHGLGHVGLVIDARRFIHAPSTGDDVKISDLATYGGLYGWVRYAAGAPGSRP